MTNHTLRLLAPYTGRERHAQQKYRCLFSAHAEEKAEENHDIMPGVDFHVLRAEITMQQVLDQLGFTPTSRTGDQLHGPCPVHRSTSVGSRSLSVNLATGRYYCHKCGSRGNQLELWSAVRELTLYEAALDLCQALGREIPWIKRW